MNKQRDKRFKKQLEKKLETLDYLVSLNPKYKQLLDHEVRRVWNFIRTLTTLEDYKQAIEETSERYRDYLILRSIGRVSSEALEILVLIVANSCNVDTRKCRKNSRLGDVKLNDEDWDIKLYWEDNGTEESKRIRDYYQNKIIFRLDKNKKKYILNNFIDYLREHKEEIVKMIKVAVTTNCREIETKFFKELLVDGNIQAA